MIGLFLPSECYWFNYFNPSNQQYFQSTYLVILWVALSPTPAGVAASFLLSRSFTDLSTLTDSAFTSSSSDGFVSFSFASFKCSLSRPSRVEKSSVPFNAAEIALVAAWKFECWKVNGTWLILIPPSCPSGFSSRNQNFPFIHL